MVIKASSTAEKKNHTERVVKTSNRYGRLNAAQVKRAVARVSKAAR